MSPQKHVRLSPRPSTSYAPYPSPTYTSAIAAAQHNVHMALGTMPHSMTGSGAMLNTGIHGSGMNGHHLSDALNLSHSAPAAHRSPLSPNRRPRGENKKCRKQYGMEKKDLWCTQCKWKKACSRFGDWKRPKPLLFNINNNPNSKIKIIRIQTTTNGLMECMIKETQTTIWKCYLKTKQWLNGKRFECEDRITYHACNFCSTNLSLSNHSALTNDNERNKSINQSIKSIKQNEIRMNDKLWAGERKNCVRFLVRSKRTVYSQNKICRYIMRFSRSKRTNKYERERPVSRMDVKYYY